MCNSDDIKYMNEISAAINKTLATLNSGGFIAFLHFYSNSDCAEKYFSDHYVSPLQAFASGLTLILLTAMCNYFNITTSLKSNVVEHVATACAILSAISFLYGVWFVALSV